MYASISNIVVTVQISDAVIPGTLAGLTVTEGRICNVDPLCLIAQKFHALW